MWLRRSEWEMKVSVETHVSWYKGEERRDEEYFVNGSVTIWLSGEDPNSGCGLATIENRSHQ